MIKTIGFLILFLHILQRIFFNLYLWQLKEYRQDRYLEEFGRRKRIISPFSSLILNKWSFPKFTKKMILLLGLTLGLLGIMIVIFFDNLLEFILIFEILLPLFVALCVLIMQIPTVILKKYIFWRAELKRKSFKDLKVIGITGSFGKSSTKEFLFDILSLKFKVFKTEGNVNTEIGNAGAMLRGLKKEHQIFICELAAYKKGEIKSACKFVKPQIGILTGINQ
ncbi:MAG: Mur ligase family protein, partial [Candidatus Pacebacteria bacterium]|nr:Mur ligase family protein [Candidatus Paceibacterota bacterium]